MVDLSKKSNIIIKICSLQHFNLLKPLLVNFSERDFNKCVEYFNNGGLHLCKNSSIYYGYGTTSYFIENKEKYYNKHEFILSNEIFGNNIYELW